MLDSIISPQ